MNVPTYPGDGFMFRQLSETETADFETYARENDPEPGKPWSLFHPACRRVWIERGLKPAETE